MSAPQSPSGPAQGGDHPAVLESRLDLPVLRRGKVRVVYALEAEGAGEPGRVLIVASDRLSAFDIVLPTPIPGKGRLLTQVAAFWLGWIEEQGLCRTHLRSTDVADIPPVAFGEGSSSRESLAGRVTIGTRCEIIPVEFVVRGYVEGSGWKDYQRTGAICGISLPKGLKRCDKLPEPIFTPATKAETGHDENIDFDRACEVAGRAVMEDLRARSLEVYARASEYAGERGIIIADTKLEFGYPVDETGARLADEPILADEALTPDSSRFWPAEEYEPGRAQRSFDKQYVRNFLQDLVERGEWNKAEPGPALPDDVVRNTRARYAEAVTRLTGGGGTQ